MTLEEKTAVMVEFEKEFAQIYEKYSNMGLTLNDIYGIVMLRMNAIVSTNVTISILREAQKNSTQTQQ